MRTRFPAGFRHNPPFAALIRNRDPPHPAGSSGAFSSRSKVRAAGLRCHFSALRYSTDEVYGRMIRNVEYTNGFAIRRESLAVGDREDVAASVELLERHGPGMPYPRCSGIKGSRHDHMRELRVQSGGKPVRVFHAFDPRRKAVPLIGGDRTGDGRFCQRFMPLADRLNDEHLKELREEGAIRWPDIIRFPS